MSALVFLDTETTGLSLDDDIWEFAAIRREPDGSQTQHHYFVEHNVAKCNHLPEAFLVDHQKRFPASHDGKWHPDVIKAWELAGKVCALTEDKPHIVGAVPNFDTERLARLIDRERHETPHWHYHLIDVEAMAFGYLWARNGHGNPPLPNGVEFHEQVELPWKSDFLSAAVGVEPPGEGERHTAMGDARWAMRLYDAITGGAS